MSVFILVLGFWLARTIKIRIKIKKGGEVAFLFSTFYLPSSVCSSAWKRWEAQAARAVRRPPRMACVGASMVMPWAASAAPAILHRVRRRERSWSWFMGKGLGVGEWEWWSNGVMETKWENVEP